MELDEAIKHAEEIAEENEKDAKSWVCDGWQSGFKKLTPEKEAEFYAERVKLSDNCAKCAKEHSQLAEWLKELKMLRSERISCPIYSDSDVKQPCINCLECDISKTIKMLEIEKQCVLRQDTPQCTRECSFCDLVQNADEVISAYDTAINLLKQITGKLQSNEERR